MELGFLASIIVGGFAGWFAQMFMKSGGGIILNIVLGVIGAVLASFVFGKFNIHFYGWLGYLISGFIGACCLIAIGRAIRR